MLVMYIGRLWIVTLVIWIEVPGDTNGKVNQVIVEGYGDVGWDKIDVLKVFFFSKVYFSDHTKICVKGSTT